MRIPALCRFVYRQKFMLLGIFPYLFFCVAKPVYSATFVRPLLHSQSFVTSSSLSNFQLTDKKIDFELLELQFEYNLWKQQNSRQPFSPLNTLLPLRSSNNGFVVVDAVAQEEATSLINDLNSIGCLSIKSFQKMVSATCPINSIGNMSNFDSLNTVRPALSVQNAGDTTSLGDVAVRSDVARSTFNVNGSGITVGTLSDSYDCLGDAAANVASGDLPADVNVLDDGACPGTDEGRAMMQIITDIAPGASQSFHTAFNGIAGFANGILELQQNGADIINDDVLFFAEPFFQDGVIAQAVNTVKAAGVAYFSSAGNFARSSYESTFSPSGVKVPGTNDELHDFDSGAGVDIYQQITLPNGISQIVLQWAEPYFSVSGAPGSGSNYNIYICLDNTAGVIVPDNCPVFSEFNNLDKDPIEILLPNVSNGPFTVFIAISRNSGASNNFLKYIAFGGSIDKYTTNSSTSVGHSNASGAEAVGAAVYILTPEFPFVTTPILNNFSSAGGTPILFDLNGNSIFEQRQKPEIVAPDGVNTTFFGNDVTFDTDIFPNFFGTSAAAPHAAAAAALMLEAAGGPGSLTPDQIYSHLETTAIDIVRRGPAGPLADPGVDNLPVGFDFDSGFGLIQTDAAILSAIGTPCNGDFDNDNDVDNSDAFVFAQAFGATASDANYNPEADFDNDGDIDNTDAFSFAQDFGRVDCLDSIIIE